MKTKKIIISAILLIIIDFLYLFFIKDYFLKQVQLVQNGSSVSINYKSVILCYLFLIFGLNYFIITKPYQGIKTVINAFILGVFVYGVYETTTIALFKKWNITLASLDVLWGGVLFSLTTYLTFYFVSK